MAVIFMAGGGLLVAQEPTQQPTQPQTLPSQPAVSPQNPDATQPPPPTHLGPVIVLDPAHGGTDTGARGAGGAVEKDVVLAFARTARGELERQGLRVVMTRTDDSNPSYDDRAAMANAYRNAIFITLHVSSTGTFSTARVYYYHFPNPLAPGPAASSTASALTTWEDAQRSYADPSHRLADAIQVQLAQRFAGSPALSTSVAIRELRSVAEPAIAIEISSVSVSDPNSLAQLAAPLAVSIARGVTVFQPPATLPAAAPVPVPGAK
jgi:N-acetylmuramoyl-L-alanine amidase